MSYKFLRTWIAGYFLSISLVMIAYKQGSEKFWLLSTVQREDKGI